MRFADTNVLARVKQAPDTSIAVAALLSDQRSGKLDLEPATVRGGYCPQVLGIGAEHDVAPPQGTLDDRGVHDVWGLGPTRQRADRARLGL